MYADDVKIFCYLLLSLNIVYALPYQNYFNQQPAAQPYASVTNYTNQRNFANGNNFENRHNYANGNNFANDNNFANSNNFANRNNFVNARHANHTIIRVHQTQAKSTPNQVFTRILQILLEPLKKILSVPKINSVMRNVATCAVNGAVELITFYFPAPLIPVIASAAGMLFPFEPVLMLKEKLPVTSYRRAFLSALNSFLGSFDKYRLEDNFEYDPYMTQRFRRRMMNYGEPHNPMSYNEVDDKKE